MNFTIYVLGNVDAFYQILNGVAMVFGQKGFLNSAFMVGGLVMLISGILFWIGGQGDGRTPGAMGMVSGMFGLFSIVWTSTIGSTVTVQDIYSGEVVQVDNVPLLLSVPASAFTTAAYKIFSVTDVAFSGVNGNYMAMGQQGFVMPLKLLFSLRAGFDDSAPNISASIKQYILDCVPGSTTFSNEGMRQAPDALQYLLQNGRPNGLTTYFAPGDASGSAAAPTQGTPVSCQQDANLVWNDMQSIYLSGQNKSFNTLINGNIEDQDPTSGTAGTAGYTQTDVVNAVQGVMPAALMGAQDAQQFMSNALLYNTLTDTFNCMSSNGNQSSMDLCNIQMTQAMEQSRTDAAGSASFFVKMMIPAMTFMQLMFFGFAPLVVIYGVMRGGGALGLFIKYLLFGVWTSSWLPFAAVINMYIQTDIEDKLLQLAKVSGSNGLTMGNFPPVFYDMLATRLQVASDMLAATPMISLSLLTGSMMAMTSLAQRWSGGAHFDPKQASPDVMDNGALVNNGSIASAGPAITGNALAGMHREDASLRTHSSRLDLSSSVQSAQTEAAQRSHDFMSSVQNGYDHMVRNQTGWDKKDSQAQQVEKSVSDRFSHIASEAESYGFTDSNGHSLSKDIQASLKGSAGVSTPFASINAAAQAAARAGASQEQVEAFKKSMDSKYSSDEQFANSQSSSLSSALAEDTSSTSAESRSFSKSISDAQKLSYSAAQNYQRVAALQQSMGNGMSYTDNEIGAKILAQDAARQSLDKADAANSGDARYQAALKQNTARLSRAGNIAGARYAAILGALEDTGKSDNTAEFWSAMGSGSPMQHVDPNENKGVGAAAESIKNPAANLHSDGSNVGGVAPKPAGPDAVSLSNVKDPAGYAAGVGQILGKTGGVTEKYLAALHAQTKNGRGLDASDARSVVSGVKQGFDAGSEASQAAYHDWAEKHPIAAKAVQLGIDAAPFVAAFVPGLDIGVGVEKAAEGVELAEAAVSKLASLYETRGGSALLGGGRTVINEERMREAGFASEREVQKAMGHAAEDLEHAHSHLEKTLEMSAHKTNEAIVKGVSNAAKTSVFSGAAHHFTVGDTPGGTAPGGAAPGGATSRNQPATAKTGK